MQIGLRTIDAACLVGLIALAAGGSVVAVESGHRKADRIARDNQASEARLGDLGKAQSVVDRLDMELKANQATLETLRKRLPESQQIGEFLADLDALAGKAGVNINKVEPGASVPGDICARTPLAFSCQGPFASLHGLLYGLESMERLVRIESVSMNRASLAGACRMDIRCSVYGR